MHMPSKRTAISNIQVRALNHKVNASNLQVRALNLQANASNIKVNASNIQFNASNLQVNASNLQVNVFSNKLMRYSRTLTNPEVKYWITYRQVGSHLVSSNYLHQ